jgi:hypothetical protein
MGGVLSRLGDIGITFLELVLIAGVVAAVWRLVTGHRDGCGALVAFLVALAVIDLWQAGWFSTFASVFLPGASAPGPGAVP